MKYITKKYIDKFIENEINRNKINKVDLVLNDLLEYPEDNKNQIKFYKTVYNHLK
jgi:hypothetical protein